jgi:hypothetical protein
VALEAFVAEHGRLPTKGELPVLAVWIVNQRQAKKAMDAGKQCTHKMTDERIAVLEAVPCWTWEVDFEAMWLALPEELKAFVAEHGRLPTSGELLAFAMWIANQRTAKKALDAGKKCGHKMTDAHRGARGSAVLDVGGRL